MFKFFTAFLLITSSLGFSQIYKDPKAATEKRVTDLVSKMTLEEKLDYIGGYNYFYIRGISRLGLPEIKMTDGPVGTRNDGRTTAYPATVLAAASWDVDLATQFGEALGKDSRARGVHILLAPGVNITRSPMAGRSFEYLGEDPFLAGKLAVGYIKGVQSQNVVATVKHFAANNQEWDRNHVSSDMDERTLQEIYLTAFKTAVLDGKVGAVMNSYNLVNGIHATQHNHLNNEILKRDWKFDGILMSDWVATYDGLAAAKGGLDLEMPSAAFMSKETLLPAIKNGSLSEKVIDDKVSRILRIIFRFGFYDKPQLDSSIPLDNPQNAKVALDIARGGIVLLKNEGNILPLNKAQTVAVVGPNASRYVSGGGSSYTDPFHSVSLLKGLQDQAGPTKINFVPSGFPVIEDHAATTVFYTEAGSKTTGVKATFFNNKNLEGNPVATEIYKSIDQTWPAEPGVKGIGADNFSVRFTGVIRPEKSGVYKLGVKGDDGFRLFVDGKKTIEQWHDQAPTSKFATMPLEAGKEYAITLEYYENAGGAQIAFAYYPDAVDFTDAVKAVAAADVAVVAVGFNNTNEGEGSDRNFELPEYQEALILAVAKANPNTVVVLNAGGNVATQNWLSSVKGFVHAWFPGQEGGTAVAEILLGKVNPSGKLPVSFEKKWEDNPAFGNYYDDDENMAVAYKEGLNVGYRYYDKSAIKPLYPFGFGLSYTTFEYSALKIRNDGKNNVSVTFTIKNTGNFDGAEIAQVYVRQQQTKVERPDKELKGFTKVFLKKGESKTVKVSLNTDSFSYFKTEKNAFGYDAGDFDIIVGASSAEVKLKSMVTVK